jgi:hypothetical protein
MKPHIIVLLALKVSMAIQLTLILARVETQEHLAYLISDTLFKTFLGLFLIMYFYFHGSANFDDWDEVFIGFGGTLLLFDAFYNVFPKVLAKFNVHFNPYTLSTTG